MNTAHYDDRKEEYRAEQTPYRRAVRRSIKNHEMYFRAPSIGYIEPFRIYGNLYYVGDAYVCIHLVDTGEGLVLIDSGYPCSIHLLTEAIYRLGFDPHDIRYILHTHGHYDHFGASGEYRRLYGCRLLMSRVDAELLREKPELALTSYSGLPYIYVPEFEGVLEDGGAFTLGNLIVRSVLVPGHTQGALCFFFDVWDKDKALRAALFGGVGAGTLHRSYLTEYGRPLTLQRDFLDSLEKVRPQRVDITLGNHPGNNDTLGKRARRQQEGGNPFIDPSEWDYFLSATREKFIGLFAGEK